jgi:hypothetical protein
MKPFLSFLILILAINLQAQEETVKKIRERYAQVNDEDAGYQTHFLELNTMQAAIGLQTTKIAFRYIAFQSDPEEDPYKLNYILAKISIDYNISDGMEYHTEYLFDDNQNLVFYYRKAVGKWENYQYRYYFNKGKLIKVIIKSINEMGLKIDYTNIKDFKEKDIKYAQDCFANAKKYLIFFNQITDIEYIDK